MIEFMILSAPRCGSTWAANWLTTDGTLCLHDPLWNWHYSELDKLESSKVLGVACTGLYHFPEWLNKHPARKVILHRPISEINESLRALGMPETDPASLENLGRVKGLHVYWDAIFKDPAPIYEFLLQKPFDAERHREIAQIEMQPHFNGLTINPEVTKKLRAELFNIIKE